MNNEGIINILVIIILCLASGIILAIFISMILDLIEKIKYFDK